MSVDNIIENNINLSSDSDDDDDKNDKIYLPQIFDKQNHVKYFLNSLSSLPSHYEGLDTIRLTALYFSVVGLDILNSIDIIDTIPGFKESIINYIYAMQIPKDNTGLYPGHNGFIGSTFLGQLFGECSCPSGKSCSASISYRKENEFCNQVSSSKSSETTLNPILPNSQMPCKYFQGHLAMAYTALTTLVTLKDDLSKVDKVNLIQGLKQLQQENGSFSATIEGSECDTRFVYCACAISYILQDWSGVDVNAAVAFLMSCQSYEGGFALIPGIIISILLILNSH
jgi:geranylgeranyl transferase type-1 subunit beta